MLAARLGVFAQGAAFTYQGLLADQGTNANGSYDFRFGLQDSAGNYIGSPITNAPVRVGNGLFVVALDFGVGALDGSGRWLEIAVRTNGSSHAYTVLSPRQPITAAPYALFASSSAVATSAARLI